MEKKRVPPKKGDIILLKDLQKNIVHSALMLNKRYHFAKNYSSTIICSDITFLPHLTVKEALLLETPYSSFKSIDHLLALLSNEFQRKLVQEALLYIDNLDRSANSLNHLEKLYLSLANLFIQEKSLIIVDHLDFKNCIELEQLYIRAILGLKEDKTTIMERQNNALDLICNQIVSERNGELLFEENHSNISTIEAIRRTRSKSRSEQDQELNPLKKVV